MDTYERHNHIKRGVSIAAAIGVGTAAFLGRRRLVDTVLHVGEGALKRLASSQGRSASLRLLTEHREVNKLLQRAESDVFRAASASGIRRHLLSNGWEEDAVGALFANAERKSMVAGREMFLSEQHLTSDSFSTVRGSRSATDVISDIRAARDAAGVEDIWKRNYESVNEQVAAVRAGIERSYVEQLRARTQVPQQSGLLGRISNYMGGVRSLTVNEALDDADNVRRLGAEAYNQLRTYRDEITSMGAKHLQGNFDLGAQAVAELRLGNAGGVYDMRGLTQQAGRVRSWMEHNFQIPVVPFSKGFSPFSLFSWLWVGKGNFVDVVANSRNQVAIADLVAGEDRLLYRLGKDLLSVGADAADPIKTVHRNIAGLNSASGFGERVYRNMLESTRPPKSGNAIKDTLNIGHQLEPSLLEELHGVIGKFSDSNFADTAFQQIMGGSADPQTLKVVANLLRREGKLTNEAASALADALPHQILKDVVAGIDDDPTLVKFLEKALTADTKSFSPKSSALREVLNDYRESGESMLYSWHPRTDDSLISLSGVLGERDPLRGSDLVRKAIHEEILAQARDSGAVLRTDIQDILDSVVASGTDTAHQARALRVGGLMQESLEHGDFTGAARILSSHQENATTAQYMLNKHLGVMDKFAGTKLVDSSETMLIRGSESILTQLNTSFSQGKNFFGALGDFVSSTAAGQYTSAFIQGVRDPSRLTQASLTQYFFAERVNPMLGGMGLALGPQDLGSTFDIMKGLALKRAVPAFAAYETWNYANYQGQELGLPTPDSVVGNIRANASRMRSSIVGGLHARQMYVGAEKYSNLNDREEQDEQLASGYEPVRGNKFWLFGSRSELMGGKIKYFRPDRYRLNQSDWEDTDEAGTGDEYWKHSILPTLRYPLSPIKHFTDPYWWEREYAEGDNALRPYPTTGPLFTRQTPWGPLLNATIGNLIKPVRVLHPEAMPGYTGPGTGDLDDSRELADAATSAGAAEFRLHNDAIARTRTAGRIAVTQPAGECGPAEQARDSAADGLGAYTDGQAHKQFRGSLGRSRELLRGVNYASTANVNARVEDTNIPDPVGYSGNLDDLHYNTVISDQARSLREIAGIYGWLTGVITGTDRPKGLVMDDPSWAYGAQGRFWGMDIGGLGGEANEIVRRFLPSRPKTLDYYNPVENSYSGTWLPGCFVRGTPVSTQYGMVPIESVTTEYDVVTHKGNICSVEYTNKRSYTGKLIGLDVYGVPDEIWSTAGHPYLVIQSGRCPYYKTTERYCIPGRHPSNNKPCRYCSNPQHRDAIWLPADEIRPGDFVLQPLPEVNDTVTSITIPEDCKRRTREGLSTRVITLDWTTGVTIGFFLAEGHAADSGAIFFGSGETEPEQREYLDQFSERLGRTVSHVATYDDDGNGCVVSTLCSCDLARWLRFTFGTNSHDKRIPEWIYSTPTEFQAGLLAGYIEGDGCVTGHQTTACSVSYSLVYGIQMLLAINGIVSNVTRYEDKYTIGVYGSEGVELKSLCRNYGRKLSTLPDSCPNSGSASSLIPGYLVRRVKDIESRTVENIAVYNLQVAVDQTYTVHGVAVHNSTYFENFQRGDPMMRLDKGVIRLPGDAYERAHGTRTLVLDASEVGYGREDMVSALLHQETPLSAQRELENDPALHKAILAGWKKSGFTTKRNFEVADKELGVQGRVDALLRFGNNVMLGDIEVLSGDRYTDDRVYDEHRDKVNFFLKQLGLKDALVAYVNADNPDQVSMQNIHYSEKRYREMASRIDSARATTMGRIEDGLASRADIYSNVERLEILADVAPYSQEYKSLLKQLSSDDTLTEAEHTRVTEARRRTTRVKKRLSLYPYHFRDDDALVEKKYTIEGFYDANTIKVKDSDRMLRFAGVRASNERMAEYLQSKNAFDKDGGPVFEQYYARLGLTPGSEITAYVPEDEDEAVGGDMFGTLRVLVKNGRRNINRQMLNQGVAVERENDWSPAAIQARFSAFERMKGQVWETIAHADTPINTKALRVRSGLEEYERSQVYGTNAGSWENPIGSYVIPSLQAFSARNPLLAAAAGGVFGSLFGRYRSGKIALAAAGAAIAGSASIITHAVSAITDKPYIPGRVQRRRELEEYYDKLSYVKNQMLHSYAEERAMQEEGVDVDAFVEAQAAAGELRKRERDILQERKVKLKLSGRHKDELKQINEEIKKLDEYTENTRLGPWATQALLYLQKSKSTMYGADGNYQSMITALPKYEREIVESILKDSTKREKDKFFQLLPDYEKRAVGMFLGKDAPKEASLEEYFKTHQLPGEDWEGWLPQVDLSQLKAKSAKDAGTEPMEMMIYPQQVDQAEAITRDIDAPTVHGNTGVMLHHLIQVAKSQGMHAARGSVHTKPDTTLPQDDITVSLDIRHDRHKHLAKAIERERV